MVSGVRQEDSYIAIRYLHNTQKYPILKLCAVLNINRSSYYTWLKRNPSTNQLQTQIHRQRRVTFEMLAKAYAQTLWLRSHILGVMYDMIDFGSAAKRIIGEVSVSQTDSNQMVCLVIPEPLPGLKELTGTLEEYWARMIHEAIAKQAKIGIPHFEKAHVHIRITAPRGTNNSKVWDTSNRAINVIINNLKGIFFDDDDFEHMSCSIEASWGKISMTEIRICDNKELKRVTIFASD